MKCIFFRPVGFMPFCTFFRRAFREMEHESEEREREKLPILFTLTHVSISSISERNMANDQDHTQYTRHSDTMFLLHLFSLLLLLCCWNGELRRKKSGLQFAMSLFVHTKKRRKNSDRDDVL